MYALFSIFLGGTYELGACLYLHCFERQTVLASSQRAKTKKRKKFSQNSVR